MIYPKELFKINFAFAEKVAELSHQSLEEVLFTHTLLYRSFNLGRDFEADHPVWMEFLTDMLQKEDPIQFTYVFHCLRQALPQIGKPHIRFGCFWFEMWPDRSIRIHFDNADNSGYGPLSKERFQARKMELKRMFSHIKKTVEKPTNVIGRTWLYNMHAYRRLFPPLYLSTAVTAEQQIGFRRIALWGQFLNNRGLVKDHLVRVLLSRLAECRDINVIDSCFPMKLLRLESSIEYFFDFYKIQ